MNQKSLSNARKYKQVRDQARAEQAKTEELFDVPVTSGFVFKCRKPNLETYIISGVMPFSLTEKLAKAMNGGQLPVGDELANGLNEDEIFQMLIFTRELVRDICASPRIVDNPANDDELAPKDILLEDFTDLVQWGMKNLGGGEAARLGNFRGKPDLNARAGAGRKKRKPKTK